MLRLVGVNAMVAFEVPARPVSYKVIEVCEGGETAVRP